MNRLPQKRAPVRTGAAVSVVFMLLAGMQFAARAQDSGSAPANDNAIVASLNPVPQGLACSDAAAQAQVSFDFQKPDFDIKQVSLYVDGKGVPQDSVTQQWPRVTLSSGLHPGRNTVEIVATGDNNRSIARQLVVLIGVAGQAGDSNAAVVQCDDSRTQVAATPPPSPPVAETAPVAAAAQTVYIEQPVYVYHQVPDYPVWPVFVPIIPVVVGYPPMPIWYAPRPYYYPPPAVAYFPAPPVMHAPPPVAYRPPPLQPQPGTNTWRTPNPITGTPIPVNGRLVPYQQPANWGGAPRPPHGVTYYSPQPSGDPRWGVVNDMNTGGSGTRYRTPSPSVPVVAHPYGGTPVVVSPGNARGQQSYWAPAQPQNGYHEAPHQSYVHEAPAPHYEAPRSMSPQRMTSAPAYHAPSHGGWH